MKHLKTYKIFENNDDSDIMSHILDVLRELEDEGLFVGCKSYNKDNKMQVIVTNYQGTTISNTEVFNHVKRLISFMNLEGYDTYEAVINSNKMGAEFTDWNELLDKYLAIPPKDRTRSKDNVFEYIDMLFYKQIVKESRSYTKEDSDNLKDLAKDIDNIMLDIADEYSLTNKTPPDMEVDFRFSNYDMEKDNSYLISYHTRATRYGVYGFVLIHIHCEKLYNEGMSNPLLKDILLRLDTIGHASIDFDSDITIEVIPRH